MNYQDLIKEKLWSNYSIGLSGCRTSETFFNSCDYDFTIFDGKSQNDEIFQFQNHLINVHHSSFSESQSKKLIQFDKMKIIHDESWELNMFLAKIKAKRLLLYKDFAKNSLIESLFCCEKTKNSIKKSSVFTPCWQKCATFFLAEGILALNHYKPSPSHMLDTLRKLEKTPINEKISTVNETIGIERSTPSLLERMVKSTIGFSKVVEQNDHFLEIQQKYDFLVQHSMLADCYFYLGYINKENFLKIKDSIEKQPDLYHILKISFDVEADLSLLEQQANKVQKSANEILELVSKG